MILTIFYCSNFIFNREITLLKSKNRSFALSHFQGRQLHPHVLLVPLLPLQRYAVLPDHPPHLPRRRYYPHYQVVLPRPALLRRLVRPQFAVGSRKGRVVSLWVGLEVGWGLLGEGDGGVEFFGYFGLEKVSWKFVSVDFELLFGG